MKYKIVPKACTEQEDKDGNKVAPTFEGHIVLDLPKYTELSNIQRELTLKVVEMRKNQKAREQDIADKLQDVADNLETQATAFEKLEPMIVEVDLRHKSSGDHIRNVEEFSAHPACRPIIEDLCLRLMFGFAEKN